MVGLDAVVAFTDEIERQLARLEELPPRRGRRRRATSSIARAASSRIFLDELVNGAPPVPLKLYPEYEAMQRARGVKAAAPTDLFYPDLSPRAPRIAPREAIAPRPAAVVPRQAAPPLPARPARVAARRRRGRARRCATRSPASRTSRTQPSLRAFWWTVGALLEALIEQRPRRRLRRQAAGRAHRPADPPRRRGQREGRRPAAPRSALLRRDQRAGRAAGAGGAARVPARRDSSRRPRCSSADVVRLQPLLREAREQLARRQGRVAQGRVGPRGEPAEAQADAGVGAHQGRRDQATAR